MSMLGTLAQFARQVRRPALATVAAAAMVLPALSTSSFARGPDGIADVAEQVIDAVVNISTSQKVEARNTPMPQLPNDPQLDELFQDFFNRRGQNDPQNRERGAAPGQFARLRLHHRCVRHRGHQQPRDRGGRRDHRHPQRRHATEGRAARQGQKTDLALLRVKPDKPLKAVKFGDSEKLRLGEWVIAIGNPFSLGGTVTAGIVSARNRDINSGPYDNYIQTDAAINRGNSGGPLFNLEGEVVGINTAIISPSGGSIGIGFAVPSKTALPVIDQLKQFGETRRGWLGVRIQQVTDEIAESLKISPPRGALVAGIDDKGPAKPAGIEPGDVIIKFDGKDIKEMRDLPRVVADTPVGKQTPVIIIRKGKEETKTVTLGRLEDGEKVAAADPKGDAAPDKGVVKKTLGLELANMSDDLRKRYKIKDSVKGVVITGVDAGSPAADKRLSAGDVIVEIAQEAVASADDLQAKIDKLKKDGRKSALMLVAGADGELRFVALSLQ